MRKGQLKPNRQIPSKVFGFRATVEQASVINLAASHQCVAELMRDATLAKASEIINNGKAVSPAAQ